MYIKVGQNANQMKIKKKTKQKINRRKKEKKNTIFVKQYISLKLPFFHCIIKFIKEIKIFL